MNITIVGAGNVGTQFAVHCAYKGNKVTIFTAKPSEIYTHLEIVNKQGDTYLSAEIDKATNNPSEAFSDAELIFVTVPAFCMDDTAEKILPHIKPGCIIALIPGTGGGECAFMPAIQKGCTVLGLQRVPSVARLVERGKKVCAVGYRDELFAGTLPAANAEKCAKIIENIFDIKCSVIPCYLNLTLTPSNPILHTTRLRTIFGDYSEGKIYNSLPLFYENWSDESSELLFKCDDEVQSLCKALSKFDLSFVKSLKIHYESPTVEALTKKITSIEGFKGLATPSLKVDGGFLPDFNSRYFTADFSYGLTIIKQIAGFANIHTPYIDEVWNWYYSLTHNDNIFSYEKYGINSFEKLTEFYSL